MFLGLRGSNKSFGKRATGGCKCSEMDLNWQIDSGEFCVVLGTSGS